MKRGYDGNGGGDRKRRRADHQDNTEENAALKAQGLALYLMEDDCHPSVFKPAHGLEPHLINANMKWSKVCKLIREQLGLCAQVGPGRKFLWCTLTAYRGVLGWRQERHKLLPDEWVNAGDKLIISLEGPSGQSAMVRFVHACDRETFSGQKAPITIDADCNWKDFREALGLKIGLDSSSQVNKEIHSSMDGTLFRPNFVDDFYQHLLRPDTLIRPGDSIVVRIRPIEHGPRGPHDPITPIVFTLS